MNLGRKLKKKHFLFDNSVGHSHWQFYLHASISVLKHAIIKRHAKGFDIVVLSKSLLIKEEVTHAFHSHEKALKAILHGVSVIYTHL